MLVTTNAFDKKVLDGLIASVTSGDYAGPLVGCKMGLFTNPITPSKNTLYADLTVATFTGYALVALTYSAELTDGAGVQQLVSNLCNFRATGTPASEVLYGYFITDGNVSPVLYGLETFPSPIVVSVAGNGVSVVSPIAYAGDDIGGAWILS